MRIKLGMLLVLICVFCTFQVIAEIQTYGDVHYVFNDSTVPTEKTLSLAFRGEMIDPETLQYIDDPEMISAVFGVYAKTADGAFAPFPDLSNPLIPLQITVGDTPVSLTLPLSVDLYLRQETLPDGFNACFGEDSYRPISLPEDILLISRRTGIQGLRVTAKQGGETTIPAANVSFSLIGADTTYTMQTNAEGIATLFPIPTGEYVLRQEHAQKGYSIQQSEINVAIPKDEIIQLEIINAENGFLEVRPMGETLNAELQSEMVPLKRTYEIFDQNGKSYGVLDGEGKIELPATVQGIVYTLQAIDAEPTDGFPVDSAEHSVLLFSGQEILCEPTIPVNQGIFQLSHTSKEDGSPVSGGTFALYRANEVDACLVFQADEEGRYVQRTPIDVGSYLLRMTYAAESFQYTQDVCEVEIMPYFEKGMTEITWQSEPATKAYLQTPVVTADVQAFPSLFETDAEVDFQLRLVEQGNVAVSDATIRMEEPNIRGVQIIELRPDGAELLVQRRLGIPETEEFTELKVSGTVQYTVHYPVSPDETIPIQLEDLFTVPVAIFAKMEERPQYALYGRILDHNGDPVAGFRVSRQDRTGKLLYEQTITDAFGAYAFFATSSDAYIVYHPELGYGVFENENGGDAILLPLQMIQGRVIDHGALGDSMITLQMGTEEIIPDVDGKFTYAGARSVEGSLKANLPAQTVAVFEEKEDELLVHVYPAATIMGAVVDENEGMVVSGALITLTDKDGALQETTTDDCGAYTFDHLLPGSYTVAFSAPQGYLLDDEKIMNVSVTAGEKRMIKRINVVRPAAVYGSVISSDGTPMGGAEIILQPINSKAKSLPDGTFSFDGLYVDTYWIETNLLDGYVLLEQPEPISFTHAGEQAEVILQTIQSASISGMIWNDVKGDGVFTDDAQGLPNTVVTLLTEQGSELASVKTESDGQFSFDMLRPEKYQLSIQLPSDMIFSNEAAVVENTNGSNGKSEAISLKPGEALRDLQYGAVVSGTLSGNAWIDLERNGLFTGKEPALAGIEVTLSQSDRTPLITTTDAHGVYQFENLRAGDYTLTFKLPDAYTYSDMMAWSAKPNIDGQSATVTLSIIPGDSVPIFDIAALEWTSIKARVWADADLDGTDHQEDGVSGSLVRLMLAGDESKALAEYVTDENGYVLFDHILPGDYQLMVQLPDESWGFVSGTEKLISQSWAIGTKLSVQAGKNMGLIGVGIAKRGSIKGTAFTDANYNGLCDDLEAGLACKVTLYNKANEVVATTSTSKSSSTYAFDDILPGYYTVEFVLDKGYRFTLNRPDAPSFNSNVPEQAGPVGVTAPFFLPMGETVLIDAGAYPASSISGAVWEDIHNTGQYAADDPPIAGLNITLVSEDQDIARTVTDENGHYQFEDLPPGTYLVRVELPEGIRFSTQTFTTGRANNIQQTEITLGKTPRFLLPMGTNKTDVDAGAIYPGTLGGRALSPDGEGVPGVKVTVMRNNDVYAEAETDQDGNYLIENLRSGQVTLHFEIPDGWLFEEGQMSEISFTIPQGKKADDINITLNRETIIVGSVWLDENANSVREATEKPLVGAVVALQKHLTMDEEDQGSIVSLTGTNVDGEYRFDQLLPGLYSLRIVPPEYTYLYSGNALPSNIMEVKEGDTIVYDAPAFMAGYIRGKVFEDLDNDGIFNNGDVPLTEIPLDLISEAGEVLVQTITDSDGNYLFNELPPLRCVVRMIAPEGYLFFEPMDEEGIFNSEGVTTIIDFAMGDMKNNINAALVRPSSIGDLVWLDQNGNGLQDAMEPGIPGIQVTLYKMAHGLQVVGETKTDEKGRYRFDQVIPGTYQLSFTVDEYLPTKSLDILPEINSKLPWITKAIVSTETFSVYSGVNALMMDAGLVSREIADTLGWVVLEDGRIQSP